jgi:hypothetical protein
MFLHSDMARREGVGANAIPIEKLRNIRKLQTLRGQTAISNLPAVRPVPADY